MVFGFATHANLSSFSGAAAGGAQTKSVVTGATAAATAGFFGAQQGAQGRSMTPNPSVTSLNAYQTASYFPSAAGGPSQTSPGASSMGAGQAPGPRSGGLYPSSLVNGVGGAQNLLSGSSMSNYFSPSSSNFPYTGAPGRGQPGSGAASSLSSMFSTTSGKDLRGSSFENDFVIHSLGGAGVGGGGTTTSSSSAAAFLKSGGGVIGGATSSVGLIGGGSVVGPPPGQQQQVTLNGSAASALPKPPAPYDNGMAAFGFHDVNEFPSLAGATGAVRGLTAVGLARQQAASAAALAAAGHQRAQSGYANLIRQPEPRNEFQIHNEDFPALPGSQDSKQSSVPPGSTDSLKDGRFTGGDRTPTATTTTVLPKRGIQTHSDGTVTGIPAGMLNDQFGMVGLVAILQAIETDPSIIPLALGHDLTTLGLNLNAPDKNLYQSFGGPWADTPCRPHDMDFHVPAEYLTNAAIFDKLAQVKLNRYTDDLLFYLFYNFGGEVYQLAAAAELYSRDWRYHKEEKCWLTRASGQGVVERTQTHERGTYYVFDATHWRKVPKEMTLEYDKLEDRPMPPPQQQQQPMMVQQSQQQAVQATHNA